MAKNEVINVFCFDQEIGRLGYDENKARSSFQYNPAFLESNLFPRLFPETGIIKKIPQTQLFNQFNGETFKGLPPQIADSLPDMFGNLIFKKWLEANHSGFNQIHVLEQLAYVSNRGMGALEYKPGKNIAANTTLDLTEIIDVLKQVLNNKQNTEASGLHHEALLNIFKIGSSAGGARPKILVAENKKTKEIIPGDIVTSSEYNHYIIKLSVDDELGYSREVIEYCYFLTASQIGIRMMPSKLIDDKHFATLRFDRQNGKKKHILTASGLTGWDFQSANQSTYENLFELAIFLKVPHKEIEELFQRMVFNVVFCNTDDHLKNHSFIYDENHDQWHLSPAYDLTYSLNPLINYKRTSRAMSINGKRVDIELADILKIADTFTIKNAKNVVLNTQKHIEIWTQHANELELPSEIIDSIRKDFVTLT